ncbi:MAG: M20 family metallo-hydrolase [Solobacterium sp.]|jgi:N-carbamoyl-L-amino-acid hydrolase|nr:M20 family metallo-hydrolase [Solobacterium sp.]
MNNDDVKFCNELFQAFAGVGALADGGVTRLGYSAEEDEMHAIFTRLAEEQGLKVSTDQAGNTFAENSDSSESVLIASHLDSVVDGGRYDGVAGVISGLLIANWAKLENARIPLRVGAIRCEESSRFGCATIGSGLITGNVESDDAGNLKGKDGVTLGEEFEKRGYSLHPETIQGLKEYLELHIEQGRSLEASGTEIGVVTSIVAPRRYVIKIEGLAEHSGATPMGMRQDALDAAAEMILAVEKIGDGEGRRCKSVATVGVISNYPNVMNVIPGEVELGIDTRASSLESLNYMEKCIDSEISLIEEEREVKVTKTIKSAGIPVELNENSEQGLKKAADALGYSSCYMPSGAGHDAMMFTKLCPVGMVFIPCLKGISHNRLEHAEYSDVCKGAEVMYEYLKGKYHAD